MEYGEQDDAQDGVVKWPFYFSALFIFLLVLGFSYLHLQETGILGQWQIVTCVLGTALASILVFLPHLFDRFFYLVFDPVNRKDDELLRKAYFDLKEMRGEMEALAVKVDKVPTVVDKIISDSKNVADNRSLKEFSTELEKTKEELILKFKRLEELFEQTPLLPEPDPGIAQANDAISKLASALKSLGQQLDSLQSSVSELPTEFPAPAPASQPPEMVASVPEPEPEPEPEEEEIAEEEEDEPEETESPDVSDDPKEEDTEEPGEPSEEDSDEEEVYEPAVDEDLQVEPNDEDSVETVEDVGDDLEETEDSDTESEPEEEPEEEEMLPAEAADENGEEADLGEEEEPVESGELDLGLPDPAETLRKVDALLAGESTTPPPEPKKEEAPKPKPGGVTSVVANVMIGIGNKPFLRGEGPGLSWDEGVPMNFVEIGKWAWSPTRKNTTLTVQVYRNDEDPDQGGKYEVKPGEKVEITPDFG